MSTYATLAEWRAYPENRAPTSDAEAQSILDAAERDVEMGALGPVGRRWLATGLKYDPATMAAWKADALMRAVCAQANYRVLQGPDFFEEAQYDSVSAKVSVQGRLPMIAPRVRMELLNTGLVVNTTTMSGGKNRLGHALEYGLVDQGPDADF